MRQTSFVVYLAIDDLLPSHGHADPGLAEFLEKLARAGIPCVWLTSKTRLQIDEPRRKLQQRDPFIAEGGCGVFLPEDYFHLRPQAARTGKSGGGAAKQALATVRLGRFTCLPIAQQQPAAGEALEALANDLGVAVVPLRSLPPRELAQNTALHPREADLARQRDFDELFFFAGASAEQIRGFRAAAESRGMQLRQQGTLWSLAIGANPAKCIRELAKLYDRALHAHAKTVGVAVGDEAASFLSACDRSVVLGAKESDGVDGETAPAPANPSRRVLRVPMNSPEKWQQLESAILAQR